MKVNFMIIGAQKCGTSTLFDILADHPSVVACAQKEPLFFSDSKDWKKELQNYEKLFDSENCKLLFEASTTYTFYPLRNLEIWNDIFEYNPDMKFLYLVRNPIDRIISSYMHTYQRGYIDLSIEEALIANRLFIDVSRYYTQISPYIKRFGRNNILLIDFDDLNNKRKDTLHTISEFLGIDFEKSKNYESVHSNVSIGTHTRHHQFDMLAVRLIVLSQIFPPCWVSFLKPFWKVATRKSKRSFSEKPKLSNVYKRMIINMLELETDALQKLINKNLSHWNLL